MNGYSYVLSMACLADTHQLHGCKARELFPMLCPRTDVGGAEGVISARAIKDHLSRRLGASPCKMSASYRWLNAARN